MSDDLIFYKTGEHNCSYLSGEMANTLFLDPEAEITQHRMELLNQNGFRRSGKHLYRPDCKDCDACISVRVPVDQFNWKRRFRRILKKNHDLRISYSQAEFNSEHYALFEKYINSRHADGDMYPTSEDKYRDFLTQGYSHSRILEFHDQDCLIGCCLLDELLSGLSAVYTWFDPDESGRSIGTYAILQLLLLCQRINRPHLYLGYWIKNCRKMDYKSDFMPLEGFINQQWRSFLD